MMKEKFKSYSFWMSVTASVILVLNNLGDVFGFAVESETVTKIVDSICGVLILFGIITIPKSKTETDDENILEDQNTENKDDIKVENTEDEVNKSDSNTQVEKSKNNKK